MTKRKRELLPSGSVGPSTPAELSDQELIQKHGESSPRVEVVPGTWRRIVRGKRSKCDAKEWVCPDPRCGYLNRPVRHLFFDIPRFVCGGYIHEGSRGRTNHKFGFSLANVEMNGACPIGNIKSQIGIRYCLA
ncbi:hypothetical protein EJB05_04645, partial [Eragrostis curvula]